MYRTVPIIKLEQNELGSIGAGGGTGLARSRAAATPRHGARQRRRRALVREPANRGDLARELSGVGCRQRSSGSCGFNDTLVGAQTAIAASRRNSRFFSATFNFTLLATVSRKIHGPNRKLFWSDDEE